MSEEPDYTEISRGQWEAVSEGWKAHAEELEERGAGVAAAWMLDAANLEPGQRVLELACGPAGVGLQAAAVVGESGSVLLTDFSSGMVDAARARAAELGVGNVDFAVADAQNLELSDEEFDVVFCRFGYMLMGDPPAAMKQTFRVLRPGGRVALAVWAEPEANPWVSLALRTLMDHFGAPPPDLDQPGIFALRDPDRLRGMLGNQGLTGARIERLEGLEHFDSVDAWLDYQIDLAGPVKALLDSLPSDQLGEIRGRIGQSAFEFTNADGSVDLPWALNVAVATRPGG